MTDGVAAPIGRPWQVVVGPTAAGKSALALALARERGLALLSADSRQLYRGFDIGTAKPSAAERLAVPHFGVVLTMEQWEGLAARLRAAGIRFGIEPHIRFKGQPGEQATMFFLDPSGNALEFKAFADDAMLFAT